VIVRSARFADLDLATLYALLRLRAEVFVVEQSCAYLDPDGGDLDATQHWVEDRGHIVACCRAMPDGEAVRIGRVATAASARGQGLAATLVRHAVSEAGAAPVVLDAQSHLVDWYRRLGFVVDGPEYVEDGIPHTPMRRAAR
jgi:ElaA protein